jgi:transposase-like protein
LEKVFRCRKRPFGKIWRVDEPHIRVKGEWRYLYRAVDFLLRVHRDKTAARRYFEKSINQNGAPEFVRAPYRDKTLCPASGHQCKIKSADVTIDRER